MIVNASRKLILGQMSSYAQKMKQAWMANPQDVHEDWDRFFSSGGKTTSQGPSTQITKEEMKEKQLNLSAYFLIRYYRQRGHQLATVDPLQLQHFEEFGKVKVRTPLELDLKNNNILKDSDLDVPFKIPNDSIIARQISSFLTEREQWTIRQIHKRLKEIYCGNVGLQSMHLSNLEEKQWLMNKMEKLSNREITKEKRQKILHELTKVEIFNHFLNQKMKTSKRFGVQGLCSMIVGLNQLVETSVENGVKYIGFGMAHRGRLNALRNVFDKPMQKIFGEFQQAIDSQSWGNSGDVKYHLGTTVQKQINNKSIRLSILPNPSHLETVNPVCMGHVKAVEDYLRDKQNSEKNTLAVLIHGDAALAGQGVVYQCLQMAYLNHYSNYGVVHIVANNQIGFTTTPNESRTGLYCTDVAKSIQAPILHVNADDPELVNEVMKVAIEYRQTFFKDIFVDIIGYRRYGHNEQDQPAFTQPMMYKEIGQRPNLYKLYTDRLIKENLMDEKYIKSTWEKQWAQINQAYLESRHQSFDIKKWRVPSYHRVVDFSELGELRITGLDKPTLKQIGRKITKISKDFTPHNSIAKIYDVRAKAIEEEKGIDFGFAEALAFGSLLNEGFNVRLSGQDVERGTFSHRHALITDQNTSQKQTPLKNLLKPSQFDRLQISNSHLSEYACLGFQYGYSMTNPNTLTIWQAQFGDFANGAQIIIDNYLTSGQSKWRLQNGVVMNLPHGMDGQGPEHSSAFPERYLQLVNESWVKMPEIRAKGTPFKALRSCNLQVINCSIASNLFHAYRRQLRRDYRKPLINLVSKKLLKLRDSCSSLDQFALDSFQTVIEETDSSIKPEAVKKVVILSGQAYYSALEKRKELERKDVAIVRIQQIAPFHYDAFKKAIAIYKNATEFIWFQQEHRNKGFWGYLEPRISIILEELSKQKVIKTTSLKCVSRKNAASNAVGQKKKHDKEQAQILDELFL